MNNWMWKPQKKKRLINAVNLLGVLYFWKVSHTSGKYAKIGASKLSSNT